MNKILLVLIICIISIILLTSCAKVKEESVVKNSDYIVIEVPDTFINIVYIHDIKNSVGIWISKSNGGIFVLPDSVYMK